MWVADFATFDHLNLAYNARKTIIGTFGSTAEKEGPGYVKTILSCVAASIAHLLCSVRDWRVVHDFRQPRTGHSSLASPSRGGAFDAAPFPLEGDGRDGAYG